jgi:hypothetical protein
MFLEIRGEEGALVVISFIIGIWFSVLCDATPSVFRIVQALYAERKDLGDIQVGRNKVVSGESLQLTVKLEARSSSGTLVSTWQPKRRHTAQNGNLCL